MKLYVTDQADPSVRMRQITWEIEVPIYVPDIKNMDTYERESLNDFKNMIIEVYKEFSDGKVIADYDYELAELHQD